MSLEYLREDFKILLDKSSYTLGKEIKIKKEFFGNIPIDTKFSQSVNRVAFVGDARGWGRGFGWGFSPILDNYTKVAENLSESLISNKLSAEDLEKATDIKFKDPLKDLNLCLEELMIVFLVNSNVDDFDKLVKVFSPYHEILERLGTFRLLESDILPLMNLVTSTFSKEDIERLLPREDRRFVIKEIGKILVDFGLIEANKILSFFS